MSNLTVVSLTADCLVQTVSCRLSDLVLFTHLCPPDPDS